MLCPATLHSELKNAFKFADCLSDASTACPSAASSRRPSAAPTAASSRRPSVSPRPESRRPDAASSERRGVTFSEEVSATVAVPTVGGELVEVEVAALERAERDLRALLTREGDMNIRSLGQRYAKATGVNFTKATGLTLACYLHSAHGAAFIVRDGVVPDKKGRPSPSKDVVSVRPARVPKSERQPVALRAARESLTSALARVDAALAEIEREATPRVKNTFLDFQPVKGAAPPTRATCGGRFAFAEESEAEEEEESEAEEEHRAPFPATREPSPERVVVTDAQPRGLLVTNMQLAQAMLAAQQQMAQMQAQMEAQAREIAQLQR